MQAVEKAGINGLITAAASVAVFGTQASVIAPMTSMTMPLYALIFLGGVASSFATDGLHIFMKDTIPISKKANDRTSVITSMAVNGLVLAGLLQVTSPGIAADFGRMMALGMGAASEFAGSASYTYLKENSYF